MSADDGQNTENLVNPSDDTQPQRAVNILQEATGSQSRRKFLRAAVMSGVGVATVAATAGVAAACQSAVPSVFGQEGTTNTASGTDPCTFCFEDTGFAQVDKNTFTYNHTSGNTVPGDFFLWVTAHNLPAGTYSFSISPELAHSAAVPFEYTGSNSAKLYKRAANAAADCPSFQDNKLPTDQVEQADTVSLLPAYNFSGSNADLQLVIHFGFDGKLTTGDHDYNFTVTLTKSGQANAVCSKVITLHAVQSK